MSRGADHHSGGNCANAMQLKANTTHSGGMCRGAVQSPAKGTFHLAQTPASAQESAHSVASVGIAWLACELRASKKANPGIEPGPVESESTVLTIRLIGRC